MRTPAEERAAAAERVAALPERLIGIIHERVAIEPDVPAVIEGSRQWTYRELAALVAHIAEILRSHGIRPGDRLLIIGENSAALVATLFALASIDATAVMLNARLSAREVDNIRDHCQPRRVMYLTHVSPEVAAHAERHGSTALELGNAGSVRISALDDASVADPVSASGAEQVAALIYTSGTTGNPKGVMLTHHNLLFVAAVSGGLREITKGDRVYGVLPISHVYGLSSVCLASLYRGSAIFLESRYTPEKMAEALRDHGITICQGVPAMYARLMAMLKANNEKLTAPRLRFAYAGGSPLDLALKQEVEALLGVPLNNGYGLTEAAPTISQTRLDQPRSDCSVGPILPFLEVRIVDAKGNDVPAGEPGELWVRGKGVMKGYYRDPVATAAVINPEGWLNTGDVARIEADGAMFIVGRTKELIIRSGFNVYPVEVEGVLNSHPAVTQAAVLGRAVEGNEEVVAFIERVPGAGLEEAELLEYAAKSLAPYKRPAQIIFLPSFPTAANGKVLKNKLKEML
ncbi:MAG: acyl--CoA ligase [Betaproteobacteria bacterium]|nr:acyl--CoA ligase [Betaproteobacteria bacterium]